VQSRKPSMSETPRPWLRPTRILAYGAGDVSRQKALLQSLQKMGRNSSHGPKFRPTSGPMPGERP
jgi:hypothetical protein